MSITDQTPASVANYQQLLAQATAFSMDTSSIRHAMARVYAWPRLTSLIPITHNLLEIFEIALEDQLATEAELDQLAPWRSELRQLLEFADSLADSIGKPIQRDRHPTSENYHPLHNECLSSHYFYALLFNSANRAPIIEQLREQGHSADEARDQAKKIYRMYRHLQWHFTYVYLHETEKLTVEQYEQTPARDNPLDSVTKNDGRLYRASTKIRALALAQQAPYTLPQLHTAQPTLDWWLEIKNRYAEGELDQKTRAIGVLARYWLDPNRDDHRGGGGQPLRKGSDAYYVDYGGGLIMGEHPSDERDPQEPLHHKTLHLIPDQDDTEEEDLAPLERENSRTELYMCTPPCRGAQDPTSAIRKAVGAANHTALGNQDLLFQAALPAASEVRDALQHLSRYIGTGERKKREKSALMGIIAWATGCGWEPVRDVRVVEGAFSTVLMDSTALMYSLAERAWKISVPVFRRATPFSEVAIRQSIPVDDSFIFPDWLGFQDLLPQFAPADAGETYQPFKGFQIGTIRSNLDRLLQEGRSQANRIQARDLERDLYRRITTQVGPVEATYITGRPHAVSGVESHYAAIAHDRLQAIYRSTLDSVLGPELPLFGDASAHMGETSFQAEHRPRMVGAEYVPDRDSVQALFKRLREHLKSTGDPRAYHNHYALYSLLLLLFTTGHRPIRHVDVGPQHRDRNRETLLIADKDDEDHYHSRRIWMAPRLARQLAYYEDHSARLLHGWEIRMQGAYRPEPATVPYLSHIGEDGDVGPMTPSIAMNLLREFEYEIPLNSARRLLLAELIAKGVARDIREAFLGHWIRGTEPHGRYALLSPRRARRELREALEPLWDDLRIEPLPSRWSPNHG